MGAFDNFSSHTISCASASHLSSSFQTTHTGCVLGIVPDARKKDREKETGTDGRLPESPWSSVALYACRVLTE